jgi:hypothetical protein
MHVPLAKRKRQGQETNGNQRSPRRNQAAAALPRELLRALQQNAIASTQHSNPKKSTHHQQKGTVGVNSKSSMPALQQLVQRQPLSPPETTASKIVRPRQIVKRLAPIKRSCVAPPAALKEQSCKEEGQEMSKMKSGSLRMCLCCGGLLLKTSTGQDQERCKGKGREMFLVKCTLVKCTKCGLVSRVVE